MAQQSPDPISSLLTEFGTRLNEVEEKQHLLRDRTLLIGENLITTKELQEDQTSALKKEIVAVQSEMKEIKIMMKRIINELQTFARRTEVDILKRQAALFQPLELARIKDVEALIIQNNQKKMESHK